MMPELDDFQFSTLRAGYGHPPVLMLTAWGGSKVSCQSVAEAGGDYLR